MSATNTCLVVSLGVMDYLAAYDLQRRLHAQVVAGDLPDLLLLLEHPHVYTHGRRGQQSHILASGDALASLGVETHFTDRGGETTYHGPGQLVGYPIVNLRRWGGGVRDYVETLERTLISALNEYGIEAHSEGKPTGVWVADAKIAAIGVRVSRFRHDARLRAQCLPRSVILRPHRSMRHARRARYINGAGNLAVMSPYPTCCRYWREFSAGRFGLAVEWSSLDAVENAAAAKTAYSDKNCPLRRGSR